MCLIKMRRKSAEAIILVILLLDDFNCALISRLVSARKIKFKKY